jgi:hypothetical protein
MNERLGIGFGILVCLGAVLLFGTSAYEGLILGEVSSVPGRPYGTSIGSEAITVGKSSLVFCLAGVGGIIALVVLWRNLD